MKWSIVLVCFFLVGCSHEQVSISSVATNKELPAQIEATLPHPPLTTQPRKFSKGEALYIYHCADCHGWEGRGKGVAAKFMDIPTPILLRDELLADKSESHFVDWVLSGRAMKLHLADHAGPETDSEVTALLAYIKQLPAVATHWSTIQAGRKSYDKLCVSCHGAYGHGDGNLVARMPKSLLDLSASDYQIQHSDEALLQIITQGKEAMPGTEDVLSPKEIKAVIAFVRLLSPGYESYDRFCAACHGETGSPMQMMSLNEDEETLEKIDMPTFDVAYLKAHTDEQLIPKIKHMLETDRVTMPHFANDLKRDQVREIFRYLSGLLAEYP